MLLMVLIIIAGFAVTNTVYLKKFYVSQKKEKLVKVGELILDPNFLVDFRNLELQNNAEILIKKNSQLDKYSVRGQLNHEELEEIHNTLNQRGYIFKIINFNDYRGKALVLFMPYKSDRYIEIISPLNLIKEGIDISIGYHSYIILLAFVLGLIAAFFFSKAIVAPILELKKMAYRIAELDFSQQFRKPRNDEIGELGIAFNNMGKTIKENLDEIKKANEKLRKDIESEKEMDKLRKEFVAYVSHELKTPIAIIQGYAQGLVENVDNEDDRNFYCDVIIEESQKMDTLVRELLLMSKIEAGYFKMGNTPTNLTPMILDVIETHQSHESLNEEVPEIISDLPENISAFCDEKYIYRVIDNFIGNAIKYRTPKTDIFVNVEDTGDKFRFNFTNECKNITEKDLESLWTPFIRLETSIGTEGHGLGLAIISGILKRHNSNFGAKLEEKDGKKFITFWFELNKANATIENKSTGEE